MSQAASKNISVSLKEDLIADLMQICNERGCSRSWFIQKAVRQLIEEWREEKRDYEESVADWEEFEKSGSKGYTSEELRKELGQ